MKEYKPLSIILFLYNILFCYERVSKMRIINGKLFTMEGEIFEQGYVEFINGKITAFGDMNGLKINNKAEDFDAQGGYILPGFIEVHGHVGVGEESVGLPGKDFSEKADPVTPHTRGIDAIYPFDSAFQKAISVGITSTITGPGSSNVIDGQLAAIKLAGDRVDDMIIKAPCAMKMALGENPKRVFGQMGKKAPMTRMAIAAILRNTLIQAKEYMNKQEKGVEQEYNMKLEALIPVLTREIPVHIHAMRTDDMYTAIRIAKEFSLRCTIIHALEGHLIAEELNKANISIAIGPTFSTSRSSEHKNNTFKTPKVVYEAGVLFAISTDHCPFGVGIQMLPACVALAVREGLPEMEGLKSITINAAKIGGIEDRVGSIAIGKDADIAVFSGHPLEFTTKTTAVFIDGRRVK